MMCGSASGAAAQADEVRGRARATPISDFDTTHVVLCVKDTYLLLCMVILEPTEPDTPHTLSHDLLTWHVDRMAMRVALHLERPRDCGRRTEGVDSRSTLAHLALSLFLRFGRAPRGLFPLVLKVRIPRGQDVSAPCLLPRFPRAAFLCVSLRLLPVALPLGPEILLTQPLHLLLLAKNGLLLEVTEKRLPDLLALANDARLPVPVHDLRAVVPLVLARP
jgi:hypothetical protein